jgi:hypothetical protein
MGDGEYSNANWRVRLKRRSLQALVGSVIGLSAVVVGFAGGSRASAVYESGFTTTPQPSSGTVGFTDLKDQAHISPQEFFIVYILGGKLDVTFSLWAPGTCGNEDATPVFTDTEHVTKPGDVTTLDSYDPKQVGTYDWTAVLSWHGQPIWIGPEGPPFGPPTSEQIASSNCEAEPVTITQAHPEITTTPSPGGPIGTAISDSAKVDDGYKPTGKVTFNLYAPGDFECAESIGQWVVSLNGGSTSTTDVKHGTFATNQVGTYRWTATYSGDDNNAASSSECGSEKDIITKATPKLSTTPSGSGPIGTQIGDSATVTGGFNPGGTVTFALFGANDPSCDGKPLHTETKELNEDGTAHTSDTFTTAAAGTYHWVASYSGDQNNNAVKALCTDESQTIGKATPTITSTPSSGGNAGTAISDTAAVAGGDSPSGTVTFSLYGAGDTACSAAPLFTSTVALTNGSAQSGSFNNTTSGGTYSWIATYNGDVNNGSVSGKCGDETVAIAKPAAAVQAVTSGPPAPSTGAANGLSVWLGLILMVTGLLTALGGAAAALRPRRQRL